MYKKILFAIGTLLWSSTLNAQSVGEAFEFSNSNLQGTARSAGFGNALGSVGGDFGCVSVNPAGIGIYRTSEISLSPSVKINGSSSQYSGNTTMDNNSVLNANHFGFVLTKTPRGKRQEHHDWKSVSFAFGMNKTGDLNRVYTYKGRNSTSSATQAMESDANLNPGNDSIAGTLGFLGYQSYLLNIDSAGKFRSVVPFAGGIDQQKQVHTRGGINEYVLTLGGNYKEKLLLGVTVGIPSVNYNYTSTYSETISAGNNNNPDNFSSFSYSKALSVTGSGINLKLGAIYKLSESLRIGAALHSPTYYALSETFSPQIMSNVGGTTYFISTTDYPIGSQFDYHLSTPWKGLLSATYLVGSKGFITADYEYVDYSSMRFSYPGGYDYVANVYFSQEESDVNQSIKNSYKGASNFRLGGELRIHNVLMARAGIGYYGNAYQGSASNSERTDLSLGIGCHLQRFFTDLGYVHSIYKVADQPYTIDYSGVVTSSSPAVIPQAQINYQLNSMIWTLGYKFR